MSAATRFVRDPTIDDDGDMIVKIHSTAICGLDLHLFDGYQPAMEEGDILAHEPMGIAAEVGNGVKKFKLGDRKESGSGPEFRSPINRPTFTKATQF